MQLPITLRMKDRLSSLTVRVIASSTLLAIIALVVIGTVLSSLFRQASENGFESVLTAHIFNLIGSVGLTEDDALQGAPNLGDLRFTMPRSGWYWTVEPVSNVNGRALRSPSMTGDVAAPSVEEVPFSAGFQRLYETEGLDGEAVLVLESEFVLGDGDQVARFRVMGNLDELDDEIVFFERQIYFYLLVFGAVMIGINAVAILLGLKPLARVRQALAQISAGTATRLDDRLPLEIRPLAEETNALIESNPRIVERSRTQVGNLAHSLKTPLAVMTNEARTLGGRQGTLIAEQAEAMRQQVEHYLQRARMAAQRDTVVFRTPVVATLERMVRVMARLNPDKKLSFLPPEREVIFAGEKEDLEEVVGNLLENAMKWSHTTVRLSVEPKVTGPDGTASFGLAIEDDGPGIPQDQTPEALKRGRRLDETKPGTGLGLSIVNDVVREYGGAVELHRSVLGGLGVKIRLRRASE